MIKQYDLKNPTMRKVILSKAVVRAEADAAIAKNRLVEKNPTTGNVQAASLNSIRVFGANQDVARADGDKFDCEFGAVNVTAGSPLVAGQKIKAGTNGKAIAYIDASLINTEIATVDGAGFTNQPATDGITVVSSSALDITQTVTVYGTTTAGAYISEDFELTGTTDVDSASSDWAVVAGVLIDGVCAGDIEVSETSGGAEIVTISAGDLSAGIETVSDGYAYNKAATIVADGASTGKVIIVHEATDGAAETNLVATLNGTTEVVLGAVSYKINTIMTGGVADSVNLDLDVTGTADDASLIVGRVVQGASAGSEAIVNIL